MRCLVCVSQLPAYGCTDLDFGIEIWCSLCLSVCFQVWTFLGSKEKESDTHMSDRFPSVLNSLFIMTPFYPLSPAWIVLDFCLDLTVIRVAPKKPTFRPGFRNLTDRFRFGVPHGGYQRCGIETLLPAAKRFQRPRMRRCRIKGEEIVIMIAAFPFKP